MKIEAPEVTLVDSMGSDLSTCNAARVSFEKESEWLNAKEEFINDFDLEDNEFFYKNPKFKGQLSEGDQRLIKYLARHNHFTPFCHAFLSFRIKANIAVCRQLAKHQVGLTINEVSRRYVDSEPTFYMPESWRARPEKSVKQGSSETEVVTELENYAGMPGQFVDEAVATHYENCLYLYNKMLESGVAPEQARLVLPLASNTEWIWSGSIAAFARVCKLRLDPHAQKETRDVAQKISDLIPPQFQYTWAALTGKE